MTPSYMAIYTADDVANAERDLAALIEAHAEETDPVWRDMLADRIRSDAQFLAEMREAVFPALPRGPRCGGGAMSNPWTPGPWDAAPHIFGSGWMIRREFSCVNGLPAWFAIATLYGADAGVEGYTDGAYCAAQLQPTARLIAAAPEMAEALSDLIEVVDYIERTYGSRINPPTLDNARALLARIRGDATT